MTSEACQPDVLDILAVGCGPFNLGLLALASTVEHLDVLALDAADDMRWHPGLMFDDARLQVNFLADLVSLVEPAHPLSFLSYLKDADRMYPFYIRERFHMSRKEYEAYLRWAVGKLDTIRFRHRVERVIWDDHGDVFRVLVHGPEGQIAFRARHLVLGVGTEPWMPDFLQGLPADRCLHTSEFLHRQQDVARARRVTVVGSGQSGGEVVLDLLRRDPEAKRGLAWLTRTESFAPLDYTKLVLEMTTPAYVAYFHGLPEATRDDLVRRQWRHYKGVSTDTLEEIHDQLYARSVEHGTAAVDFRCGVAIEDADVAAGVVLHCHHRDEDRRFLHETDLVVAATGYKHRPMPFLAPVEHMLVRDEAGRLDLCLDHSVKSDTVGHRIFVVNADLHTHGVAAPDLGICAWRNATILNQVAGREVFRLPRNTAFTTFPAEEAAAVSEELAC